MGQVVRVVDDLLQFFLVLIDRRGLQEVSSGLVWLTQLGRKSRPVVILTRTAVIDVRELVTVAEITTSIRGLAVEGGAFLLENLGRIRAELDRLGLADETLILYTSDHGSHFRTRNSEYKRSCHEASVRVPAAMAAV